MDIKNTAANTMLALAGNNVQLDSDNIMKD